MIIGPSNFRIKQGCFACKGGAVVAVLLCATILRAQSALPSQSVPPESAQGMQARIDKLEAEVGELKAMLKQIQSGSVTASSSQSGAELQSSTAAQRSTAQTNLVQEEDRGTLGFLRD